MTPVTSAGKAGVRERIPDKSWLSNRFEAQSGGLGQGQGQGDDCADLQDLELKGGRECSQQHGPEGCPRTCFTTTTKR